MRLASLKTFGVFSLMGMTLVSEAHANPVSSPLNEKSLGAVVAVERQFAVSYETCEAGLNNVSGYSYVCAVELKPESAAEFAVTGGTLNYRNQNCIVEVGTLKNGYAIQITEAPRQNRRGITRGEAIVCLRDAFAELNLANIRLRAVVYTPAPQAAE